MFGTNRRRKSRLTVFLVMTIVVFTNLLLPFAGKARVTGATGTPAAPAAKPTVASPAPVFQAAPAYDKLLQDNSSGDMLRFNSTTGAYLFSRCSNGYTLSGTGTVTARGCTFTLSHTPADRRVQASFDGCQNRGTASIQVYALGTTFTITDSNTTNDPGLSDSTPPQVNLTAPNGSELLDAGASFTMTWNATDNVGVTKQDVLLSTDGGASFTAIAQGLAGDVTQYAWIAPLITSNQTVRIRVLAYDAACNVSSDDSDANFTIVNSGTAFTHVADTSVYMLGGGFNSMIHLCSAAANNITVELGVRNRFGTGLASLPAQFTLAPGQVRAINLANYLTPGTPPTAGDPNVLMGSIRLRHNGSQDSEVRALVAVDRNNEAESFTVPFVYVGSSQSPNSTMQCAPLYYIDDQTSANLSLQNVTNAPVQVSATLHYGTGAANTPNGTYSLPFFTLAPQGSAMIDLSQFADQVQGTHWGSITLNAPPQSVVAHTVMRSAANQLAFNSNFVDPMMCGSATKAVGTLKLDYAMNLKSCLMVCNTSSADTRDVTVSFQSDNGVNLPSQQFSLAPNQQKLIELDSQQLLQPGASTRATARLSYSGNAADIIGSAVSMSAARSCAIPAQFVEPKAADGRHLVSPFFRFDVRTSGILQLSNFSASDVKAGAMMKFADTTLPTLNTDLITIPAGGTAAIDLQSYFNLVDDGVAARGCVEVLHNGAAGSVTGTFTAIGKYNDLSLAVPLEGAPAIAATDMVLFPNSADVQPNDAKEVAIMTGGGLSTPNWSVSANTGNPGSIVPLGSADANVYRASYTAPTSTTALIATVKADTTSSGGSIQSGNISLSKVGVTGFTTQFGNGRMNPKADTTFTMTGNQDFPDGALEVKFKQGVNQVFATSVSRSPSHPNILTGIAPLNTSFIGDAQIIILQNGTKISKDKTFGEAYYAFNPPSPPTATTPDGYNRTGGILTITANVINGNGFETFNGMNPNVNIEGLNFTVNTVTASQINGLVLRASANVKSCQIEGQTPCKIIKVTNPGGRSNDKAVSAIPLYNLKPGPPPFPHNRFPDNGYSIGGTAITIRGQYLDFTDSVTVGGTPAVILAQTESLLEVLTPPHTAGGGNAIILFDIDNAAPGGTAVPGGNFRYDLTPPTDAKVPGVTIYIVGPGEGIEVDPDTIAHSANINCISDLAITLASIAPPPNVQTGVQVFRVTGSYTYCGCTQSASINGSVSFTLLNTAGMGGRPKTAVTKAVTVSKYIGTGSCNAGF